MQTTCSVIGWAVWVLFAVDYVARVAGADDRVAWIVRHPLEIVVLVLPMLRPLRVLRLVMLLRVLNRTAAGNLRGRVAIYVSVGAVPDRLRRRARRPRRRARAAGASITTFGDAMWWACTTMSTVGYGDLYPMTTSGRFIAVGLMFGGIALLGTVTATFASWLVEAVREEADETEDQLDVVLGELAALRQRLDRVLEEMTEFRETEVWLVRHGETEWSRDGRHTSSTDLPLTARGRGGRPVAAAAPGRRDLRPGADEPDAAGPRHGRALGLGDAEVDADLVEWGYGDYEGTHQRGDPRGRCPMDDLDASGPGGETRRPGRRASRPGGRPAARASDGPALVFGHGHALRALTARWLGLPVTDGRLFRLDTATLSRLGYERENPVDPGLELLTRPLTRTAASRRWTHGPGRGVPPLPRHRHDAEPGGVPRCPEHGEVARRVAPGEQAEIATTSSSTTWARPTASRRTCPGR